MNSPSAIAVGDEVPVLQVSALVRDVQDLTFLDRHIGDGGYEWGSPHNSDYAREVLHYRGGLVHGISIAAYASEMLGEFFGEDWQLHGRIDMRFISGVAEGDTLRLHAKVMQRTQEVGGVAIEMEVWAENLNEPKTPSAVGTASCLVTNGRSRKE